eukprot:14396582-Heterocapsa_arctica.AAC.1
MHNDEQSSMHARRGYYLFLASRPAFASCPRLADSRHVLSLEDCQLLPPPGAEGSGCFRSFGPE